MFDKKAYMKKYREENRERIAEQKKGYHEENREKIAEYKKRHASVNWLPGIFRGMKKASKKRGHPFDLTFERLQELWQDHFKTFGMFCRVTREKMNTYPGRGSKNPSKVSVDRIDPTKPYHEPGNLIFVTWEFNKRKASIRPDEVLKLAEIITGA